VDAYRLSARSGADRVAFLRPKAGSAKIAYVTNKSGSYQIWTMNADGTGQKQLTDAADAHLAVWRSHP
jgi:Tol biopolymer transport system component